MAASFKVVYFENVKQKTKKTYRRFRRQGRGQLFVTAAATIDRGLQTDPRGFGDPCFTYPALKLDVYVRAVHPLVIHYGVHQTEPVVFVHGLEIIE